MKIWHVGSAASPQTVDGVNNTVWAIAQEQARIGHQVTLVLDEIPDDAADHIAQATGLQLAHIPASTWRYAPAQLQTWLTKAAPDIVHFHSVFLPKQAHLAQQLYQHRIPYVITPHGGLYSQRGRLKKWIYNTLIERQRFARAAAVTVVTPKEAETIQTLVPNYAGMIHWLPNPIDLEKLRPYQWQGNVAAKRLVFLGRFDVLHKGIDRLIEIARYLPEVTFDLYGKEDPKTLTWLQKLQRNCPANVSFHPPVFGTQKYEILTQASLYIQTSRWEGFPVSIAEAMSLGIPCAVSAQPGFAELFQQEDLGLVLPESLEKAASLISEVLNQPLHLNNWSQKSQVFAQDKFRTDRCAQAALVLYGEVKSKGNGESRQ